MAALQFYNHMEADVLVLPGVFIDYYLPAASGECVRIYLYLLRAAARKQTGLSTESLAAKLDISERELLKALAYWEESGLLSLHFQGPRELDSIVFLDVEDAARKEQMEQGQAAGRTDSSAGKPASPAQSSVRGGESRISGTEAFPPAPRPDHSVRPRKEDVFQTGERQPSHPSGNTRQELTEALYDPDYLPLSFMLQSLLGREITAEENERFCQIYVRFGKSSDKVEELLNECLHTAPDRSPEFEDIERTASARLGSGNTAAPSPEGGTPPVPGRDISDSPPSARDVDPPVPSPKTGGKKKKHAGRSSSPEDSRARVREPYTPDAAELAALEDDTDFQAVLFLVEQNLSTTLSGADAELLGYWYLNFDRSPDILESLLEYCMNACAPRKPNITYMSRVAQSWFSEEIRTAQQAREYSHTRNKTINTVLKALGYGPRNPRDTTEAEEKMILSWVNDLGMPLEMIQLACERAASRSNGKFQYANSILLDWNKKGILTAEDVRRQDEAHYASSRKAQPSKPFSNTQQAHNFEERDTDYEALLLEKIRNGGNNSGQ